MNYGCEIDCNEFTNNNLNIVGYREDNFTRSLFSQYNLDCISKQITQYLKGVDEDGKDIVVSNNIISNVLSSIYNSYYPQYGDMYSRFIIPYDYNGDFKDIIDRTISVIVQQVRDNILIEQQNKKLTVWTTVLGDFNNQGLRSYAPIKLNERRNTKLLFNMNY